MALVRLSKREVIPKKIQGPGSLIAEAYDKLGVRFERVIGRVLTKSGIGPQFPTKAIESVLRGVSELTLKRLSDIYAFYDPRQSPGSSNNYDWEVEKIEKHCEQLTKYALPSKTSQTQLETFKDIIRLTTSYPGLRLAFIRVLSCHNVDQDVISHWKRPDDIYMSKEWILFRQLAASCIGKEDSDTIKILNEVTPIEFGTCHDHAQGAVEKLLTIAQDTTKVDNVQRMCAVRYLGGILRLGSFWNEYRNQRMPAVKLLKGTLVLVENLGLDPPVPDLSRDICSVETEGVDFLVEAVVSGINGWAEHLSPSQQEHPTWLQLTLELLDILQGYEAAHFLSRTSDAIKEAGALQMYQSVSKVSESIPVTRWAQITKSTIPVSNETLSFDDYFGGVEDLDLQKAYVEYQGALYGPPTPKEDPRLWYDIGIYYERLGQLSHAEEAFESVLRVDREFDKANDVLFRLGIIYKHQRQYPSSLKCFERILRSPTGNPPTSDIWLQLGYVHELQKDYVRAKEACERVVAENPHHAKGLQRFGWLYHQLDAPFHHQGLAITYLTRSLEAYPNDAQSWDLIGRSYMQGQQYNKAYESYQQAIYRDSRNATFWCSIGVLYFEVKQYRDAFDAYCRAVQINPSISEVWFHLGALYESCDNQTDDAILAFARASELDPGNKVYSHRLQLLKTHSFQERVLSPLQDRKPKIPKHERYFTHRYYTHRKDLSPFIFKARLDVDCFANADAERGKSHPAEVAERGPESSTGMQVAAPPLQ